MANNNNNSPRLSRDSYKIIKHMDKRELTAYLSRLYERGYHEGFEAARKAKAENSPASTEKSGE